MNLQATTLRETAAETLRTHLRANPYPGRGLVLGRLPDGDSVQIYWIMGRSENSRNRRFVADGTTLRTAAVDASKLTDPSLIIYEAMLELPDLYLVSNGDQTRTLADTLAAGGTFEEALATREREPDAPNYTPRISGMIDWRGRPQGVPPLFALNILRANDADPALTDCVTWRVAAPPPGLGRGLTTYAGDGAPLPPFRGDPRWFPTDADPSTLLDRYWDALDAGNRVALAVKVVPAAAGAGRILVRNRFDA